MKQIKQIKPKNKNYQYKAFEYSVEAFILLLVVAWLGSMIFGGYDRF